MSKAGKFYLRWQRAFFVTIYPVYCNDAIKVQASGEVKQYNW